MDLIPSDDDVKTINSFPWAWTVGFLATLLGVFIGHFLYIDNDRTNDCLADKTVLVQQNKQLSDDDKQVRDELVRYLLTEKERKVIQTKQTDSVVRAVVGNKAKLIIINSHK